MAIAAETTVTVHLTDTDAFRFNSSESDKIGIQARVIIYRPPATPCRVSGFNVKGRWVSVYIDVNALPEHVRTAIRSAIVESAMSTS